MADYKIRVLKSHCILNKS